MTLPALPPIPTEVAAAFARWPADVQDCARRLRALIFAVAEERGVGPLTETLKWGEPAYLADTSKSGSTIRLGRVPGRPGAALLFNCRTSLIEGFRRDFASLFHFDGNRALILDPDSHPDEAALALCIGRALTYHWKHDP
jgi:hypothetical protein